MNKSEKYFEGVYSQFIRELEERSYSLKVGLEHSKFAKRFVDWCIEQDATELTEELCNNYLDQRFGRHLFDPNLNPEERREMRSVRMLTSLELTGEIEFRTPRTEIRFLSLDNENVTAFCTHCENELNLRPSTVLNHKLHLRVLDRFLSQEGTCLSAMNTDLFEKFFSSEMVSMKARKQYKSVIRSFCRWMYDTGRIAVDVSCSIMKEPKVQTGEVIPTTYTEEEIGGMLASVNRASSKGKRDYLVLLLAAQYGWRAGDIVGLKFGHINWPLNKISFAQQKTGNPVEYPLLASVGNAIIDYLKSGRPNTDSEHIIVSHENTRRGHPLSSSTVHSIVTKALKDANVEINGRKHGSHSLRFSLATNAMKRDYSISIIGRILGHKVPDTTMDYLKVDIDSLKRCSLEAMPCNSAAYKGMEVVGYE